MRLEFTERLKARMDGRDASRIKCPYCKFGWFHHHEDDTWMCDGCGHKLLPPDDDDPDPEVLEVMREDQRRGKKGGSKSGRRKKPVKKVVQGMYEGV